MASPGAGRGSSGDNRRPMNALFEDGGKFHAGRVMSETDTSLQIELASGKRSKVKAANVLLRFAQPEPEALLGAAEQIAREIDLDLAWEFAPEGEFAFAELARDYFGAKADVDAGGGGAARACSTRRTTSAASARGASARRRKRSSRRRCSASSARSRSRCRSTPGPPSSSRGSCPAPVREQLYRILFKPDKNAPEYKAVVEASRRSRPRAARPAARPPARSTRRTSSTGAASCSRSSRRASASPTSPVPSVRDELALSPAAGVLDRRLVDDRDRRRALGAGPRHAARSRSASTSPRRRSRSRRTRRWRRSRATACRRSTSRATS